MTIASSMHRIIPRELQWTIWAFPAAFFLHAVEEILAWERFAASGALRPLLPAFADSGPALVDVVIADGIILLAILFISSATVRDANPYLPPDRTFALHVFMFAIVLFLVNVLAQLGQALTTSAYVPGLKTAIVVCIPYASVAIGRLFAARYFTRRLFATMLLGAMLLHLPLAMPLAVIVSMVHRLVG